MPGVGFRTVARVITETSGRHFETAGHLAAYAGLAPISRRSGTSIRAAAITGTTWRDITTIDVRLIVRHRSHAARSTSTTDPGGPALPRC